MWGLLAGTLLSTFPKHWRKTIPAADSIPWERAAALSGILESLAAIGGLLFWYSRSVTTWAANALDSALRGGPESAVPSQVIGFAALVLWVLHPLTWILGYFVTEGAIRVLGAAFTGHVLGTLPLFLTDWVYGKLTHRQPEGDSLHSLGMKAYTISFLSMIRDRWQIGRLPQVPDELVYFQEGEDQYLLIKACRPKAEWNPPRIVRVDDGYYRLEETTRGVAPRPFVHRLRRLSAGVPGRTVLVYKTNEQTRTGT